MKFQRNTEAILLSVLLLYYIAVASGFECPPEAKQLYYKVGENKECMKCSPGYYWLHHCIFNLTNAVCTPCPKGSYSPCNNIALACERCDTHCPGFSNQDAYKDREYISEACTAISNIKCSCRQSYYKESGEDGMCTEKQPCPPGSGVLRQATDKSQTQCHVCSVGKTFSNITSLSEPCQNCTVCAPEEHMLQDCTLSRDRVCGQASTTVSVDANSPKGDSTVTIVAILATSAIVIVAIIVGILRTKCGSGSWRRCFGHSQALLRMRYTNIGCRWPSRRPTNKELGTIADCFTGDYQILATQLEVSPERVYRIQRDHNQDIHSQVFAVLLDWANATAAPTLADLETEMRNVESLKFNWVNANKKLNVEQYDISNAQL
ncbi:tumor necrosis factor receptor superfamily member 14-like [Mya arenaria]|uniref:tumor necrosis factor receptor superfamily member 14-like n=1 Tax=Mya arenaria TaxID=6604 RepID=UPI0022E8A5B1|nr:tumor necrosis factor receptor superfamily member 14-like [Mya arenaria]